MNQEVVPELAQQMGRPVRYGGEFRGVEERARHMVRIAEKSLAPIVPEDERPGFRRMIKREPVGVVLVIAPWNYPFLTAINTIVPALVAGTAAATECTAYSGARRARVVELYTSEGCNSCPPADRWIGALAPADDLALLAFHVDYWDYLGWRDRYADPRYSQRQHDTARRAQAGGVYTPEVVLDGRRLKRWDRGLPPADPAAPAIDLALRVEAAATGLRVDLQAAWTGSRGDTQPRAFLLENVAGLAYESKSEGFDLLKDTIRRINRQVGTHYSFTCNILRAAAFGVPQERERIFIVGERSKHADGVTAAADARDDVARQFSLFFQKLLPRLIADDALEIAHNERIRMGADDRSDHVKRVVDVAHPVTDRLVNRVF